MKNKLHASVVLTYRCNAKCNMCESWRNPTRAGEEISVDIVKKLPDMFFCNITGGEPFIRDDMPDFVEALRKKAKRIVINTNGYFTDKIISLCKKYPDLGIRLSMEGLSEANDKIRGLPGGFDRCLRTLFKLRETGMKDIGLNMTVQDINYKDLVCLYQLAYALGYEFATTTVHNSHYFHKSDNVIKNKEMVIEEFEKLIRMLLKSRKVKEWFRAYYNHGLINYIRGNKRLLPCEMGENGFFMDPWGDILPCNGMDKKQSMGNLNENSWEEIWHGKKALEIRQAVRHCEKNCWMIGSAAPAIWCHPLQPILWVLKRKLCIKH